MRLLKIALATFVIGILLICMGISIPPLQFVLYLLFAWIPYLRRVLPQVQLSTDGLVTGILCLAGTFAAAHFLLRWLYTAMKNTESEPPRWRARWTLISVTLVLVMFAAGIAASGVVHQSVWLARSDAPMFSYGRREGALAVYCQGNMRRIMSAIQAYASEHDGAMPASLEQLVQQRDIDPSELCCPASEDDQTPRKYVYIGGGMKLSGSSTQPVLAEPLINHGSKLNMAFADSRVNSCSPEQAERYMNAAGNP